MRNERAVFGCFSINEKGATTKVVVMGGQESGWNELASAEILDVASMQWEYLPYFPFATYRNKGVESVIGPYLGFSVAGWNISNRIIGLRKNQIGTYFWQELTTQLTTSRHYPAVVNVPESMVPSC